jgi:hypothetical protein
MVDAWSSRVRDALHRVDADAVRGGDHTHAWAILPAQRGVDRSLDVGSDLARRRPARTRSWMIARSNSANTPIIWNMALPAGVVVSRPC